MFKIELIAMAVFITFVMTGLGTTLSREQFREVLREPYPLFIGFLSQFLVMPCIAFFVAKGLGFEKELALSVVLLGAAPGGVNSNLFTYYARSNLCLSVSMTVCSTFISVVSIPVILFVYSSIWGQQALAIPYKNVIAGCLAIVLPVILGMVIRERRPELAPKLEKVASGMGVILLFSILAFSITKNQQVLIDSGISIFLAGFLVSFLGFVFGYGVSKASRLVEANARAVSFETGLQNVSLTIAIIAFSFPAEIQLKMAVIPGVYMIFVLPLAGLICFFFRSRDLPAENAPAAAGSA